MDYEEEGGWLAFEARECFLDQRMEEESARREAGEVEEDDEFEPIDETEEIEMLADADWERLREEEHDRFELNDW